jgi:hypothetical protein
VVIAALHGFFQPIDGRYHWYGRIQHDNTCAMPSVRTHS